MTNLSNLYTNINNLVKGYEKQSGSDGSSNTVFTLSNAYVKGNNTLLVFVNGQKAEKVTSASDTTEYEETNNYTITFGSALQDNDVIEFYIISPYNLSQDNFDTMVDSYQDSRGGLGTFKNKIINGNFDIWQRGTSFSSSTSAYSSDRWLVGNGGNSYVASQQAFTVGQTDVPNNPKYFERVDVTYASGAGYYNILRQHIEDVTLLSGKTITVSFYAKADSSKNIVVEMAQYFGTGGSSLVPADHYTVNLTTSWQKFTYTFTLPSVSGKTVDDNSSLRLQFWLSAGSTWDSRTDSLGEQDITFDIAQVQLEEGSSATAFESRSFGQELALCQRYFIKLLPYYYIPRGYNQEGYLNLIFPVQMRATPTASYTLSQTTSDHLAASAQGLYGYIQADWTGTPSMVAGATFDAEL